MFREIDKFLGNTKMILSYHYDEKIYTDFIDDMYVLYNNVKHYPDIKEKWKNRSKDQRFMEIIDQVVEIIKEKNLSK